MVGIQVTYSKQIQSNTGRAHGESIDVFCVFHNQCFICEFLTLAALLALCIFVLTKIHTNNMSEFTEEQGEQKVQMIKLGDKEYKPLADGKYDVVILGSGFKECLLAGLLAAVGGKKVLQLDRNNSYGGDCASLNLEEMCKRHNVSLKNISDLFGYVKRNPPSRQ